MVNAPAQQHRAHTEQETEWVSEPHEREGKRQSKEGCGCTTTVSAGAKRGAGVYSRDRVPNVGVKKEELLPLRWKWTWRWRGRQRAGWKIQKGLLILDGHSLWEKSGREKSQRERMDRHWQGVSFSSIWFLLSFQCYRKGTMMQSGPPTWQTRPTSHTSSDWKVNWLRPIQSCWDFTYLYMWPYSVVPHAVLL